MSDKVILWFQWSRTTIQPFWNYLSTDKNKNTVQITKSDQTSPSPREQEGLLLLYQLQLQLHSVSLTSQIKIKISNHRIAPISERLSANVTQAQITKQSPLNPILRKCLPCCPWCAVFLAAVSIRLNSACLLLCFLVLLAGGHKHLDVDCSSAWHRYFFPCLSLVS